PTVRPLLSTFYPPPRRASSSTLFPYTTLFRSRRLVHDQDTRVQGKRFRNFDTLAVAYRQRADFALHVDVVNVERGEDFTRPPIHRPPIDHTKSVAWRVTDKDILGDGEFRIEAQFLINRSDTALLCISRVAKGNILSVDANRPGIRLMYAGHDLDEGGFSRAIF